MRKEGLARNIEESPLALLARHYCYKVLPKMCMTAGRRENLSFNGLTLIYDGRNLFTIAPQMVNRPNFGFGDEVQLKNKSAFLDYFASEEDNTNGDRTYFFNTMDSLVKPYKGGLKNHKEGVDIEQVLSDHLPPNFLSEDSNQYEVGCRVETAAFIPVAYEGVESVILKQTGFGKLAHFDHLGLVEEFSLIPDPASGGPFIDPMNMIIGVYACYRDEKGSPFRDLRGNLAPNPARSGIVNEYLENWRTEQLGPYKNPSKIISQRPSIILPNEKQQIETHQAITV